MNPYQPIRININPRDKWCQAWR